MQIHSNLELNVKSSDVCQLKRHFYSDEDPPPLPTATAIEPAELLPDAANPIKTVHTGASRSPEGEP